MLTRVFSSVITIFILSLVSFAATELAPGDPMELILGPAGRDIPRESLDKIRTMYRMDVSPTERYAVWAKNIFAGNLGLSLKTNRPVVEEFRVRIPISAAIAFGAIITGCIIGFMLGILSVFYENRLPDHMIRTFYSLFASVPVFISGLFLLYVFSFRFGWFPLFGTGGGKGLILPIVSLGTSLGLALSRILRNTLLSSVHEEYFIAAIGKGLSYRKAVMKHAFLNSLTPVVTFLALRFAGLLGGILLVENVFGLPGIGSYIFEAISQRDYPVIQGYIIFFGVMVVTVNLFADVLIRIIDPRPAQNRMQ